MCLLSVAVNAHEDYPLVLTHNRDEHLYRTATPLALHGDILMATDAASGGTWMGVNVATGAIASLTNVRSHHTRPGTRSRGELVLRVLRGDASAVDGPYANYNLVHGTLTANGPPELSFSACAPPTFAAQTRAVPKADFVAAKSNDHSGEWTTASGPHGECRWAKVAWLREGVERLLRSAPMRTKKGEAGARALLAELEPLMSARALDPPHAARAACAEPSEWSKMPRNDERALHRAPFIVPREVRHNGKESEVAADATYGTVSQSVLVQCRSAGCLFYAYRETLPRAGVGTRSKRRRGDGGEPEAWTWRRVELPRKRASTGEGHDAKRRR